MIAKNCNYFPNNSLAFDEERLIKKLNELAKEGWILQEMSIFRFKLVKDTPQELQYTLDIKHVDKESEKNILT